MRQTLQKHVHSSIRMILIISVCGLTVFPFAQAQSLQQPISGIGYYAEPGQCTDAEGNGSSYNLTMTGSLKGCHYVFIE